MKAIALHQFYLPYVLPRSSDWTSPIGINFPGYHLSVKPMASSEELFPNEIDKTLSTMTISVPRVSLTTSKITVEVRDRCLDRIQVRVEREISSPDVTEQVQDAFWRAAIRACNIFLSHCRAVASISFITLVRRDYVVENGRYHPRSPYTVTWFNGDDGSRHPVYTGGVNAIAHSGAILSPGCGGVSMALILQSLQKGEETNLPLSLVLDAEEHLRTLSIREAIIALGTACEIAFNEYVQRKGISESSVRKTLKPRNPTFAEWRFHLVTSHVSGRSLLNEKFDVFDLVEKTYKTRNKLAHEGRLYYLDRSGTSVKVNEPIAIDFLAACKIAVSWMAQL